MMERLVVVFGFFIFSFSLVLAADDTFVVNQVINSDATPPSTSTLRTVVPISYSQIDLTWSTSTDDVFLSGYQVWRDGVQVATTTQTSYSDTGLTPTTTYSYFIRSFDNNFNYSSSSNVLGTTTLGLPSAPTNYLGYTNSTKVEVKLKDLNIETTEHTAKLTWDTSRYSQYQLRWGRTTNYELGFVTTDTYAINHATYITDLETDTVYEYELTVYDRGGNAFVVKKSQFKTEKGSDTTAPPNVTNIQAWQSGVDVSLRWTNPNVADFSNVRVVRSHLFFPNDPYDGYVVYQGSGEEVLDQEAFKYGDAQYYTVFAYDESNNVSSGAVVSIVKGGASVWLDSFKHPSSTASSSLDGFQIDFLDIEVYQAGRQLRQDRNGEVRIDSSLETTLKISYYILPEHLKTITATFYHPTDEEQSFTFLLRINKDKSAYEATIAPFEQEGFFKLKVSVFDYQTLMVHEVAGTLVANYSTMTFDSIADKYGYTKARIATISLLLILMLLILAWLIFRRKEEDR